MSRIPRARTTGASLFIGAVVGSLVLTGCGAGQVASTAEQVASSDGTNTVAGPIVVRNAYILYPETGAHGAVVYEPGASAPLEMIIVNQLAEADRLVSATSPWASSVTVTGQTELPGGRALAVSGEAAEAAATTAAPAGAQPSATVSPAEPQATVPGEGGTQIVLTGLLGEVTPGPTYEVVLTFENAGEIRVQAPVGPTDEAREEPEGGGGH